MPNCLLASYSGGSWPGGDTVLNFRRFKYIVYRVRVVISIVGFSRSLRMGSNFDRFHRFPAFVSVWYWLDVTGVETAIALLDTCARWLDASAYRRDARWKPLEETGTRP